MDLNHTLTNVKPLVCLGRITPGPIDLALKSPGADGHDQGVPSVVAGNHIAAAAHLGREPRDGRVVERVSPHTGRLRGMAWTWTCITRVYIWL